MFTLETAATAAYLVAALLFILALAGLSKHETSRGGNTFGIAGMAVALIATIALGLIIGGAIGNAIDRFAYGAVLDFALFHVQIGEKTFNWYVFNLADTAIVAGVAALLYDSFFGGHAVKAP